MTSPMIGRLARARNEDDACDVTGTVLFGKVLTGSRVFRAPIGTLCLILRVHNCSQDDQITSGYLKLVILTECGRIGWLYTREVAPWKP